VADLAIAGSFITVLVAGDLFDILSHSRCRRSRGLGVFVGLPLLPQRVWRDSYET
jgi:hypothetical protein